MDRSYRDITSFTRLTRRCTARANRVARPNRARMQERSDPLIANTDVEHRQAQDQRTGSRSMDRSEKPCRGSMHERTVRHIQPVSCLHQGVSAPICAWSNWFWRDEMRNFWMSLMALLSVTLLSGCGYNTLQSGDEQVEGGVVRGAEPVPAPRRPHSQSGQYGQGLRRTGEADPDRVTEARAKVGSIQATPELINDPRRLLNSAARRARCPARCRGCWW
jgi:hypothetical protein